jgi:DNA recombination protein RmuC
MSWIEILLGVMVIAVMSLGILCVCLLQKKTRLQGDLNVLKASILKDKEHWQEKLDLLEKARESLSHSFSSLSVQALDRNNRSFLDLATTQFEKYQHMAKENLHQREQSIESLVKPLKESLSGVDQKLGELEKERLSAYQVLRSQVSDLLISQKELRLETGNLVKALRAPHIRGRWGEMQLRRVVEMSGMSAHCDFLEQVTCEQGDQKLRPDMIVQLPGQKQIIIDAKAPLSAYLESLEAKDETGRLSFLKDHARQIRQHILALSRRDYWDHVSKSESPEFVVLFLPGETFFGAALEQDPSLIELGVENKVILATPSTLIALLHAIAYGWRQERLSQNAQEISELGKELYKRLADMGKHLGRLGVDLNAAVSAYNKTVGTIERRVLPCARKFKALDASSSLVQIDEIPQAEVITRTLQAPELAANNDESEDGQSSERLLELG